MSVIYVSGTMMSLATFITYVIMGHTLTPQIIFATMYLYGIAQWPLLDWPFSLSKVAVARTAAKRLHKFLMLPDLQPVEHNATLELGMEPISYVCLCVWWVA